MSLGLFGILAKSATSSSEREHFGGLAGSQDHALLRNESRWPGRHSLGSPTTVQASDEQKIATITQRYTHKDFNCTRPAGKCQVAGSSQRAQSSISS